MSPTAAPPRPSEPRTQRRRAPRRDATPLGSYSQQHRKRQIVAVPRRDGGMLVIDWLAGSRTDARLVGEIAAEEPAENARILARLYLADPTRGRCRRVIRGDLQSASPPAGRERERDAVEIHDELQGPDGSRYRLRQLASGGKTRELRWTRDGQADGTEVETVSLRHVIGALESYQPARTITEAAIDRHRDDRAVSIEKLRLELGRINDSPTVLNRGLREAVQARVQAGQVSMSEIAIRCGRVKRAAGGQISGETSWLARRIGVKAETPGQPPTPWVHIDVLALIARDGLGICPCEVELG